MDPSRPLVSILIPSYNHERYIEETIRSIWEQPYNNIEIVVADDCSSDGTIALLQKLHGISPFPMKILVNERQLGPPGNCNRAIAHASGELVSFIASDDLFTDDPFTRRVEMFQQDPELQIVYSNGLRFNKQGIRGFVNSKEVARLLSLNASEILEFLYTNTSPLFLQTALLKKELILKAGCFDETILADDWYLNTRIFSELASSEGRFAYWDEPVFLYRIHGSNIHQNTSRHIALKKEFIEKITPAPLKGKAKYNILYGVALMAMRDGRLSESIDLFRQSREGGTNFKKSLRFFRKFITSATVGAMWRQVRRILQG